MVGITKASVPVGGVVDRNSLGSTGQVLTKKGPTENDYGWVDLPPSIVTSAYSQMDDGFSSTDYRAFTPLDITNISNQALLVSETSGTIKSLSDSITAVSDANTVLRADLDALVESLEDYMTLTSGDARYVRKNTATAQVLQAESLKVAKTIVDRIDSDGTAKEIRSNSSFLLESTAEVIRRFGGGVFTGVAGVRSTDPSVTASSEAESGYFDIVREDLDNGSNLFSAYLAVSELLPRRIVSTDAFSGFRTNIGKAALPFKSLYIDDITLGGKPLLVDGKINPDFVVSTGNFSSVYLSKTIADTAAGKITFSGGVVTNTVETSGGTPLSVSASVALNGTNLSYSGGVFTGKAGYYTGLVSAVEVAKQGYINVEGAGTDGENCKAILNVLEVLPRGIPVANDTYQDRRTNLGSPTYPFRNTYTDNLAVTKESKLSKVLLPTSVNEVANPITSLLGGDYKISSTFLPNMGKYKATYGGHIQYAGAWQWESQGGPGTPGVEVVNDGNRFKWTHNIGTEDYTLSILTVGQSLPEIYEKTSDYVVVWFRTQGGSTQTTIAFDISLHV